MSDITVTMSKDEYDELVEFKEKIEKGMILISDPHDRFMYFGQDRIRLGFIGTREALNNVKELHEGYVSSVKSYDDSKANKLKKAIENNEKLFIVQTNKLHDTIEEIEKDIEKRDETIMLMENSWKHHEKKLKSRWWKLWL